MLKIKTFPRIHVSLIGMNRNSYRINGGVGFSISSPTLNFLFEPSDTIDVVDERENGFTDSELEKLKNHIKGIQVKNGLKIGIKSVIPNSVILPHVGFGSSTMTYIACTEALLLINNIKMDNESVISLSKRGGTSGVGITTYFEGGFVLDVGIKNNEKRALMPSSSFVTNDHSKPLILKHLGLPKWELGVCIPPIIPKTEIEENIFFQNNCPIEKSAVDEILYEAVYGITSSLMENDFRTFCKSIDAIQQTKWKSLERKLYGEELIEVDDYIRMAGAKCVGMSSLGPMLYFFGEKLDFIIDKINEKLPQCVCFKTSFNNISRIVEND